MCLGLFWRSQAGGSLLPAPFITGEKS
jgi:hypothetical protein